MNIFHFVFKNQEEILTEMNDKVTHRKLAAALDFDSFLNQELNQNIDFRSNIHLHFPITSHRKYIGGSLILLKKITRNLLSWLYLPLWQQQIHTNRKVEQTVCELVERIKILEATIKKYEDKQIV